jgi:hypothetical protein
MIFIKGLGVALVIFGVVILLIQIFPYLVGILAIIGLMRVLTLIKPPPPNPKQ